MEYIYQTKFFEKTFLPEAQQPKTLLTQQLVNVPGRGVQGFGADGGVTPPVPRKGEMVSIGGVKRMVMGITHIPEEHRVYIELGNVR